jgi:hypothetical protein
MVTKSKICFVVPVNLQQDLRERVIKDNYGLRGKSKWVSEAIEMLTKINNFAELVHYSDEMHGFDKTEAVVLDYKTKSLLEESVIKIRKVYPAIEGVKSRIIRTAILQRLLRT